MSGRIMCMTIIGLLFGGCAQHPFSVDDRLVQYLNGINPETYSLSVQFSNELDTNIAGQCRFYPSGAPLILINETMWAKLNEKQRQWVMDHELGHCVEYLQHDNSIGGDGCPNSKMYWHIPQNGCL